jgi:two-component system CitB family sensor kinase
VHRENEAYLNKIYLAILSGALVGIVGAALLARNIKRSTYGLEPKEIALLLGQREIVLESIKLGIIAVDKHYKIIWINKVAISEFGFSPDSLGRDVRDGYPKLGEVLMRVMESETPVYNEELRIHQDLNLMCSHTITRDPDGDISGVVSSFENMTEVKAMAEELIGYKKMTEALRAQSHEFMNKLQTISGLVQLGETDEVLTFISEESDKRIDLAAVLSQNIRKKHVAAILLAKYNQVTEAKYMLNIDSSSNLCSLPDSIHEDELCSVLGNLIDNAQEAFTSGIGDTIDVWISESVEGVDIEVKDNGPGVPAVLQAKVFERGVTTKSESRGLGLNIVRDILENAGGSIQMTCDHGTVFKIHIPWE